MNSFILLNQSVLNTLIDPLRIDSITYWLLGYCSIFIKLRFIYIYIYIYIYICVCVLKVTWQKTSSCNSFRTELTIIIYGFRLSTCKWEENYSNLGHLWEIDADRNKIFVLYQSSPKAITFHRKDFMVDFEITWH